MSGQLASVPIVLAAMLLPLVGTGAAAAPIRDNSFLVEEGYNQEARVVQHVGVWSRFEPTGEYVFAFTQEWPLFSQRHQLSYTIPRQSIRDAGNRAEGWGDVEIHYRWQWLGLSGAPLAAAPRITLRLPTGDAGRGLGTGAAGAQFNLPLSAEVGRRLVSHTNLGVTYTGEYGEGPARSGFNLGQSVVWLLRPGFNPLIELVWSRSGPAGGSAGDAEEGFLLSPGFRWAIDFPNGLQVVPGFAYPVGLGAQRGDSAVLLYLSLEHGL